MTVNYCPHCGYSLRNGAEKKKGLRGAATTVRNVACPRGCGFVAQDRRGLSSHLRSCKHVIVA